MSEKVKKAIGKIKIFKKLKEKLQDQEVIAKLAKKLNIPIKNTYTGAMVTPGGIRIIDIIKEGDKIILNAYVDEPIEDKEADPYGPETAKQINRICKNNDLWARTITNLNIDKNFYLRQVEVPVMEESELVESLRFSERESVPFPIDNAAIDVWKLPEEAFGGKMKVRMAALDGEVVKRYNNLFKKTLFKHVAIIPVSAALAAILEESKIIDTSVAVPVISVGRKVTGIYVFDEGYIKFSRDVNFGSGDIDELLGGEYVVDGETITVNEEEAEELKNTFGIPQGEGLKKEGLNGITGEMVLEKIQPALDKMVTEFGRSIDYFKNEYRVMDIPVTYMIGPVANLKNLTGYLTDSLGYKFTTYNPFDDFLTVEKPELEKYKETGSELTLTIGIPLTKGVKVNLLPPVMRYSYLKFRKKVAPILAVIVLAMFIMLLKFSGTYYIGYLKSKIIGIETQIKNLKAEQQAGGQIEDKIVGVRNDIKAIDARMGIYPELKGRNVEWAAVYKEISKLLPEEIALESINISFNNPKKYAIDGQVYYQQLSLNGKIRGEPDRQVKALREFLLKMQFSPMFKHASLISSNQDSDKESKTEMLFFTIASDLKGS